LNLPLGKFYEEHQAGSRLRLVDAEQFADPRQTTYSRYVARSAESEAYVEGVFASMEEQRYDERLPAAWKQSLASVLGSLRFPVHGLQMASAYVGQMAPSGKITVCALFQTADELRRIQRIAYRLTQLAGETDAVIHGKDDWQNAPMWQPLRELIERLLVAFDWAEALIALNVCIKPIIDEVFMVHLPKLGSEQGDYHLTELFGSLAAGCRWHQDWAFALLDVALRQEPRNSDAVAGWLASWQPRALSAARAFEAVLPGASGAAEKANEAAARRWRALADEKAPA
jgi:toluene monooxygenase system protein E